MSKIEEFKSFISNNPNLIKYVKNKEKTWQQFYEIYDIYGEDDKAWDEYLKEDTKSYKIDDIVNMIKKVDVDKVSEGITSAQKVLGLLSGLFVGKEVSKDTYTPRPIYKKFDD